MKSIEDFALYEEPVEMRELLEYWFNGNRQTPTKREMNMWFYKSKDYDEEIIKKFKSLYLDLDIKNYNKTLAGILGIILIYDQLPRHIFRDTKLAFATDKKALKLSQKAIEDYDLKSLKTLEKIIFTDSEINSNSNTNSDFYLKHLLFLTMPLQHSEDLKHQDEFKNIWDKMHKMIRIRMNLMQEIKNDNIDEKTKIPQSLLGVKSLSLKDYKILFKKYEKIEKFLKNVLGHSEGHINRLKQFGRFPKRNEVLERKNTPEEEYFLKSNRNGHY